MQQPTRLISTPFAQEGEKTEIQNVTGEFDNSATYRLGFPPITMQSIRLGGKPPKGTDFNGVLFDITENISFLCKGGRYQYNAGLSTLIGGYPEGSNLLLDDNVTEVVSTVAGNQNNPNINMTGWILKPNRTTAEYVADASGETQQQVNYNGGAKWHSRVGGYQENERVVLANGDIVKSTIDGNLNDPNIEMTGWKNPEAEQNAINDVTLKYVVLTDELLAIESPEAGWTYRVLETGTTYQFDPSQVAINNGGTILNGWVAIGLKYVTPEMFGADPTGATSSRVAIKRMIDSLSAGGVIECKPNAIYYNDAPSGASDSWTINQDNVLIIANGATFKRRATSVETTSIDANISALRVNSDNVTIQGKVKFSGSEGYYDIVNSSGVVVASGDYVRGYASSHGLYLYTANNFTALDIDSRDAVFNVYASLCENLNIKGYCKSSGQVYPLVGVDLQLGSGIKTANCTNINIDLITDYAGYAGCEIEPRCKVGKVKSVARNPVYYGVIFEIECEDLTVESVAIGAVNGAPLRIGRGCKRIVGTYTGSACKYGLLLEPSSSDATPTGDITQCDIRGVSHNCVNRGVLLVNWVSGGAIRESSIHHRSNSDGGGVQPAFTIENAVNCSFNLGVNTAKGALVVNRVYESEIHMAYMKNITDTNPMYFTSGNTVDLTCRISGVTYVLKQTTGVLIASSLNAAATALPVVALTALDIRASQIVTPSLPTANSSAITNGLWIDTANSSQVKRKV